MLSQIAVYTKNLTAFGMQFVLVTCILSHLPSAPDDYTAISGLLINYRGGNIPSNQETLMNFDVVIETDADDEPPEEFLIHITPTRTVVVLTPWIEVDICGG